MSWEWELTDGVSLTQLFLVRAASSFLLHTARQLRMGYPCGTLTRAPVFLPAGGSNKYQLPRDAELCRQYCRASPTSGFCCQLPVAQTAALQSPGVLADSTVSHLAPQDLILQVHNAPATCGESECPGGSPERTDGKEKWVVLMRDNMWIPTLTCIIYVLFVHLGPRMITKPLPVKWVLQLWNLSLAIFSAVGSAANHCTRVATASQTVVLNVPVVQQVLSLHGCSDRKCVPPSQRIRLFPLLNRLLKNRHNNSASVRGRSKSTASDIRAASYRRRSTCRARTSTSGSRSLC